MVTWVPVLVTRSYLSSHHCIIHPYKYVSASQSSFHVSGEGRGMVFHWFRTYPRDTNGFDTFLLYLSQIFYGTHTMNFTVDDLYVCLSFCKYLRVSIITDVAPCIPGRLIIIPFTDYS